MAARPSAATTSARTPHADAGPALLTATALSITGVVDEATTLKVAAPTPARVSRTLTPSA